VRVDQITFLAQPGLDQVLERTRGEFPGGDLADQRHGNIASAVHLQRTGHIGLPEDGDLELIARTQSIARHVA
jgi:hypothetical protein